MAITFIAETATGIVGVRKALPSRSLKLQFEVTRAVECDKNRYGEMNVSKFRWFYKRENDRGKYASKEEFVSLFESERMVLQGLALLLTASSEAAERCLSLALQECIANSSVSKDWMLAWARRMIIRNAINVVMEPEEHLFTRLSGNAETGSIVFSEDGSLDQIANSHLILALPDFDRLVFVICILERHPIQDCALLLDRPPREINEARQRAIDQVKQIDDFNDGSRRLGDGLAQIARNGGAR